MLYPIYRRINRVIIIIIIIIINNKITDSAITAKLANALPSVDTLSI